MNSVAAKENRLKPVMGFALNVFSTRFFYQAANSFAAIKIPNRLFLPKNWFDFREKTVCELMGLDFREKTGYVS